VNHANAAENASPTTSGLQKNGQTDSSTEQPSEIAQKLDILISLQTEANELAREGNSLILALIEAMGEDHGEPELYIPPPL